MSVTLETERLILRLPDPERDFDAWAEAMADADTVRYLGTLPMSRAESWRSMATVIGHWSIRGYGFFSLEDKATGEWVGRVGPWFPEGWPEPEIGWTISPRHLRKGYAYEAAKASIAYVKDTLGWKRVIHVILPGNTPSEQLAIKLGSPLIRTQDGLSGITDETVGIFGQDLNTR